MRASLEGQWPRGGQALLQVQGKLQRALCEGAMWPFVTITQVPGLEAQAED